jgi:hypothetical protein
MENNKKHLLSQIFAFNGGLQPGLPPAILACNGNPFKKRIPLKRILAPFFQLFVCTACSPGNP